MIGASHEHVQGPVIKVHTTKGTFDVVASNRFVYQRMAFWASFTIHVESV
jgi:hypothetical protein